MHMSWCICDPYGRPACKKLPVGCSQLHTGTITNRQWKSENRKILPVQVLPVRDGYVMMNTWRVRCGLIRHKSNMRSNKTLRLIRHCMSMPYRPRTESSYFGRADLRTNRALFPETSTPQKRALSSSRLVKNSLYTRKILNLPRPRALTRGPHENSAKIWSFGGAIANVFVFVVWNVYVICNM